MPFSSTLVRYSPSNITRLENGHLSKQRHAVPPGFTFNILCAGLNWQVTMAANEEPTDGVEQSPPQILYQGKIKLMLLASKRRAESTPSNRHLRLSLALIQNEK